MSTPRDPPDDPHAASVYPKPGVVLVIEDEQPLREMFRRSLLLAGFDVLVASGGQEGLRMLEGESDIAVVMLDLTMPGFDGRKFRAAQLASERLAKIPTIIMSGYQATQSDRDELQAADYLTKPIGRDDLLRVIGRYCKSGTA